MATAKENMIAAFAAGVLFYFFVDEIADPKNSVFKKVYGNDLKTEFKESKPNNQTDTLNKKFSNKLDTLKM